MVFFLSLHLLPAGPVAWGEESPVFPSQFLHVYNRLGLLDFKLPWVLQSNRYKGWYFLHLSPSTVTLPSHVYLL